MTTMIPIVLWLNVTRIHYFNAQQLHTRNIAKRNQTPVTQVALYICRPTILYLYGIWVAIVTHYSIRQRATLV